MSFLIGSPLFCVYFQFKKFKKMNKLKHLKNKFKIQQVLNMQFCVQLHIDIWKIIPYLQANTY